MNKKMIMTVAMSTSIRMRMRMRMGMRNGMGLSHINVGRWLKARLMFADGSKPD